MSVKTFLLLIALSAILRAEASEEVTFKNVTVSVLFGNSIKISKSNNLSKYLPKTAVSQIKIYGRIPVLYENSVSNIKNVNIIFFVINGIKEIQPGAFKNFEGVRILDIVGSNLTVIKKGTFEDLPLEQLFLNDNNIEEIEVGAFANLPNLKELSLTGNKIKHLQSNVFDGLSIEVLILSENLISKIPQNFFGNFKVQDIYLEDTKLTTILGGVFTNNTNLRRVFLSSNEISFIESDAFDNMPNLEKVDLSWNNLTKLDAKWFHNSPNIKILKFARNSIEDIPNEAFKGNFSSISLRFNRINRILSGAFKGVTRIEFLDLSRNQNDQWDRSFVGQIDILNLSFNNMKCPEGDLGDVFRANKTLLEGNPLDDKCLKKIEEWNKMHTREGRAVYSRHFYVWTYI